MPDRLEEADPFQEWYRALERRHMADLTFQEVRRAVQALSAGYVQKRGSRIARALETAGKRAAFAMFYAPLHFLTVRGIVREIGAASAVKGRILDLGCGTGAAGAAFALEAGRRPALTGVDGHPWAVDETRWTYRTLGLQGTVERQDLTQFSVGGRGTGIVAAFTINELEPECREAVRGRLLAAGIDGASVLVVEPIARRPVPWWDEWAKAFASAGGLEREWRVPAELPDSLRLMDKAARLDHRELTARFLWLPAAKTKT